VAESQQDGEPVAADAAAAEDVDDTPSETEQTVEEGTTTKPEAETADAEPAPAEDESVEEDSEITDGSPEVDADDETKETKG